MCRPSEVSYWLMRCDSTAAGPAALSPRLGYLIPPALRVNLGTSRRGLMLGTAAQAWLWLTICGVKMVASNDFPSFFFFLITVQYNVRE